MITMSLNYELIVAVSKNWGIGNNGEMPWKLTEDLKRFKAITEKHIVIMGKNTFFSIPDKFRPLCNRINVIITRDRYQECFRPYMNNDNVLILTYENLHILESEKYKQFRKFVIGGESIYKLFKLSISNIYLTFIEKEYESNKGKLSESELKDRIKTIVSGSRYGKNGYFWINDTNAVRSGAGAAGAVNTAGLIFGGFESSPVDSNVGKTETWNGTNWTEEADLSGPVYYQQQTGAGTASSAISFGGEGSSNQMRTATEEWTKPTFTIKTIDTD